MASLNTEYDVIVVGAGIMGSTTAYFLAKHFGPGKVLLLEQFDCLHRRGSSHGESRIIRRAYPQDHYAFLMNDAYNLWNQAELESGTKVFSRTGGIDFGSADNPTFQSLISTVKKHSVQHQVLSPSEAQEKFPTLQTIPPNKLILYCLDSGILNATKSVSMFQKLFQQNGGHMFDNDAAMAVERLDAGSLKVTTANGKTIFAKKIIITAGGWTGKLIKKWFNVNIPLEPVETSVAYWNILSEQDKNSYSSKNFPVFINYDEPLMYGTPAHEYPNMIKCCAHYGIPCDPENRQFAPLSGQVAEDVRQFVQEHFSGIANSPAFTETCVYTKSPDEDFIIDQLLPNVWVGCGFSGHGFKLGPVVGKILAKFAIDGQFPYPESIRKRFRLSRFKV